MIAEAFLDYSTAKLKQFIERIEACIGKLTDADVWARGHESENSIGNLCLHLTGNVRQWILAGLGGEPDIRDRDAEFQQREGCTREELIDRLKTTVLAACERIQSLTPERLEEFVTIQKYRVTVLQAVYQVVEHFAQHTGQIVFATKALSGEDLGFYRHLTKADHDHGEKTP